MSILKPREMKRFVCVIMFVCLCVISQAQTTKVRVAAAANLRDVMGEMKLDFQKAHPDIELDINFGASGVFAQQIINGADFDVFLSADEDFPKKLAVMGLSSGEAIAYAAGKLVLYSTSIEVDKLGMDALMSSKIHKIAVANPNVATYGTRAVAMLKSMGLYEKLEKKLIFGENIGATAQYVFSGNVELGIIALSQIKSPTAQIEGFSFEVPENLYEPIVQGLIVVKKKTVTTQTMTFKDYVLGKDSEKFWTKYGYSTPR